ncbi:MAG: hypothetical protein NZL93_00765, partial [Chthoniobacterales bacterium]|nr:hypothetical protein [Chthoniobacterales bacterium]
MVSITCNSFEDWRNAAKRLLILRIPPHQTNWLLEAQQPLFPTLEKFLSQKNFKTSDSPRFLLPKRFLDLAQKVAAHTAPERWITLYSLAWRLIIEGETHLLQKTSDLDVRKATLWAKAVGREI